MLRTSPLSGGLPGGLLVLSIFICWAGTARADDPSVSATPDVPETGYASRSHEIDRTTLYGDDARIAAPLTAIATLSFSYTNIGSDPTQVSGPYPNEGAACYTASGVAKPCYSTFSNNTAQPGGQMIVTGEMGVVSHVSILGNLMVGAGGGAGVPSPDLGGTLAARFQLFPDSWRHIH